jgi:transcription elongation GreA/GreB family factor
MAGAPDEPIYLTAAGRRRLEQRVAAYRGEVAALSSPDEGQPEEGDTGDAALQLAEADDRDLVRGLAERARDVLARARPLPDGPDDGVVRLGSTVRLRDAGGAESRLQLVDGAELEEGEPQVSADSPVGKALLGRRAGDEVAVDTPGGGSRVTLLAIEPYRAGAGG